MAAAPSAGALGSVTLEVAALRARLARAWARARHGVLGRDDDSMPVLDPTCRPNGERQAWWVKECISENRD